ncbi:pitrilysin family protein [Novosphingobium sp.]|uniref:M16 family metallopeptidase n=1 Tax=Novosphingobium sp. TaxID=1874826 RepID=UPI0027346A7B|nr:M16 family metallopeptidase [Novosphingobium sp.]MDP3907222.1 insulinase family protein [Novosphingobium sp.]
MLSRKFLLALSISTFALSACAPRSEGLASASGATALPPRPTWAFEASDVPVDPGYRFGQLENGMRYVIRSNATPKGTGMVRMQVAAGSLDEEESERGFAHYVEHMAFNGSTNLPEGEMVKLLERQGLAFGAHTNASTSYDRTTYMLDLPRGDPALLDTALMIMRETASELVISPDAVERERGVVLAEMRDRNTFALRNYQDSQEFLAPDARFTQRLAIGTAETLNAATAESLRAFWQREYVPRHTTLLIVGDFDAAEVEAAIQRRFGDWRPAPAQPQPSPGPLDPKAADKVDVFVDPALSERIIATRIGPWLDERDSIAQRRENLLRQIGYAILNRRLLSRTREGNAPFRSAGLGSGDVFRVGRTTSIAVDTVDGKWQRGLTEAVKEYRRALRYGFSAPEVAEQVANIRKANLNAAASESTRSHSQLLGAALALINDDQVPDLPSRALDRLEAFIPLITPETVMAALQRELVPLEAPLLRFHGRRDPEGGAGAIRAAWDAAMRAPIKPLAAKTTSTFAYTDFGPAGTVVSDTPEPLLGIRQLRFANGVRLNLKRTAIEKERVLVQLSVDGGQLLRTRENPHATNMMSVFAQGGLGQHSRDELDSLLAGRTVSAGLSATDETFVALAGTTPSDLELQLQMFTAQLTEPGYRREGEVLFRQTINNMFASLRATPGSALNADLGAILSDNDPRFSLGKVEEWRALTFDKLKTDVSERLANGAVEIGLVGDFDEDQAIALVGKTLGALPPREAEFRAYADRRTRPFTADRSPRTLRHTGAKDQALLTLTWPTRDGEDPVAALELQVLDRVVQLAITDTLREKLGKAYSPGVNSNASRTWRGYGTFSINASVDVGQIAATRAAILETLATLRGAPISADMLLRARAPMLEGFDNALKTNGGWLTYVDRAQTEADRIERYTRAKERTAAITPARLQELVRQYLTDAGAVEVTVLPEGVDPPQ